MIQIQHINDRLGIAVVVFFQQPISLRKGTAGGFGKFLAGDIKIFMSQDVFGCQPLLYFRRGQKLFGNIDVAAQNVFFYIFENIGYLYRAPDEPPQFGSRFLVKFGVRDLLE